MKDKNELLNLNKHMVWIATAGAAANGYSIYASPNLAYSAVSAILCLGCGAGAVCFWKQYQKGKAQMDNFVKNKTLQENSQNYRN